MNTLLKTIAILLIVSAVFATTTDRRRHSRNHLRSKVKEDPHSLLIIDAGSSKTEIQLFNKANAVKYMGVKDNKPKEMDCVFVPPKEQIMKLGDVLAGSKTTDDYAAHLVSLIESLGKIKGCEGALSFKQVWLQSTAGSRNSINKKPEVEAKLTEITSKAEKLFKEKWSTYKPDEKTKFVAEVITGRYEGIYGWFSAIAAGFIPSSESNSYVYVEVGGASIQVVFENKGCDKTSPTKRRFHKKSKRGDVKIIDQELYSFSFLGLGQNDAIILAPKAKDGESDCLGLEEEASVDFNNIKGTSEASGRRARCIKEIQGLFASKDSSQTPFDTSFGYINNALKGCNDKGIKKTKVFWNGANYFAFLEKFPGNYPTGMVYNAEMKKESVQEEICGMKKGKSCLGAVFIDQFMAKLTQLSNPEIKMSKNGWTLGSAYIWEKNGAFVSGIDKYLVKYQDENIYKEYPKSASRRNRRNRRH